MVISILIGEDNLGGGECKSKRREKTQFPGLFPHFLFITIQRGSTSLPIKVKSVIRHYLRQTCVNEFFLNNR